MRRVSFVLAGLALTLALSSVAILATAPFVFADNLTGRKRVEPAQGSDMMTNRVESARKIIAEGEALKDKISQLREESQVEIAQAKRLKGEAQVLRGIVPPLSGTITLTSAQLKAAQNQYAEHIEQFKQHADAYREHLSVFRKTIGDCHANEAAYQQFARDYTLHVAQFHVTMPDIPPPHVCGVMDMTGSQVKSALNSIRANMQRIESSESQLLAEENRLAESQKGIAAADAKLTASAKRENQEKDLFDEFGKLRTEYSLLQTEKQAL